MIHFSDNLKHLRNEKGLTQEALADKLGINRAQVGSYEEGRAEPKYELLQRLSYFFKVSIHDLIDTDLTRVSESKSKKKSHQQGVYKDIEGKGLRVLPIVVDRENRELISVVPVKAAAGYLNGYADPEYIESLPAFNLPIDRFGQDKTYRTFQVSGDSMLPIEPGSYIISEYLSNWNDIRDGKAYIVVTSDEGIVFKRAYNRIKERGTLLLKSDNLEYDSYEVKVEDILEIWPAVGCIRFDLQSPEDVSVHNLSQMVLQLQKELSGLKKKVKAN